MVKQLAFLTVQFHVMVCHPVIDCVQGTERVLYLSLTALRQAVWLLTLI
jgi:hypothetical protein